MAGDLKSHGHHQQKNAVPGYIWLLSGLAIGLFIAFLVYLDKQPASEVSFGTAVKHELEKIKHKPAEPATDKPVGKSEKPKQEGREPKFNFYTILPELEVLIPDEEIRPPEKDTETTQTTQTTQKNVKTGKGKQFILQAGSFRNRQDAERLKASIALLGMEASIKQVSINGVNWHRVRVGPVSNSRDLYHDLNLLHHNDINAIAMELKQD
jgi:cell division protein FtsN